MRLMCEIGIRQKYVCGRYVQAVVYVAERALHNAILKRWQYLLKTPIIGKTVSVSIEAAAEEGPLLDAFSNNTGWTYWKRIGSSHVTMRQ